MFDMIFGSGRPYKISDGDEVSHLITVYDVAVLGIVRGMLEDENIPYLTRERDGSAMGIITGLGLFHAGTDIYVPTSALENAKALVAEFEGQSVTFLDENGNEISADEAAEGAYEDSLEGE